MSAIWATGPRQWCAGSYRISSKLSSTARGRRWRDGTRSRFGRFHQILQIDAPGLVDDQAGKKVGQRGFLHIHRGGGTGRQRHIQAPQAQRLPVQQFLGDLEIPGLASGHRIGPKLLQHHVATDSGGWPTLTFGVPHIPLEPRICPQQFYIEGVAEVGFKRMHRQLLHQQTALRDQRGPAETALVVHLSRFALRRFDAG